jgi:catechol-2,3-dioxygenase
MGLSDCRVQAVLAVSDLDRAKGFYERQLGLVPGDEDEQGVTYRGRCRTSCVVLTRVSLRR